MQHDPNQPEPPILVTAGDPCGIGPEVIHGALMGTPVLRERAVCVIGDVLPFAMSLGDNTEMHRYHIVPYDDYSSDPEMIEAEFGRLDGLTRRPIFIDLGANCQGLEIGVGSSRGGELAIGALDAALELIGNGLTDTLVTGPINKHWVHEAGFEFPGHTELLGEEFSADPVMVMVGGGLRVALLTIHEQLAMVPGMIRKDLIRRVLRAFDRSLRRDFGIANPRIAVCGLNPHAGEAGRFGREELDVITPALRELSLEGLRATGPVSADSVYPMALKGEFDGVLALYHDQGLIPVKVLAFDSAVNLTANLPIVRTSPDHGTAYGIAGKGVANWESMRAAIELANQLSRQREAFDIAEAEASEDGLSTEEATAFAFEPEDGGR